MVIVRPGWLIWTDWSFPFIHTRRGQKIEPVPAHPQLNIFERAFSSRSSGCFRECHCGRRFYEPHGGWDWEPGELERLATDPAATPLPYSVGSLLLEGHEFCLDCDCWRVRAVQIINWLQNHDEEVAAFLRLERKRKEQEADRSPVVDQ